MNLDFENTEDVSDAAIEWVLSQAGCGSHWTAGNVREECRSDSDSRATIIAARLIQEHHPELLVDPDLLVVREFFADRASTIGRGDAYMSGKYDETRDFVTALKLYRMGKEAGRAER